MAVAADLSEDLQGMFLLIARAAMDRAPCPSDGVLARARGSRSPRRARSLLTYMEQQGLIACHEDVYGNRIIPLPALGWETAPGSPDAEERPAPDGGGRLDTSEELGN